METEVWQNSNTKHVEWCKSKYKVLDTVFSCDLKKGHDGDHECWAGMNMTVGWDDEKAMSVEEVE